MNGAGAGGGEWDEVCVGGTGDVNYVSGDGMCSY